jgi:hypothetical protein
LGCTIYSQLNGIVNRVRGVGVLAGYGMDAISKSVLDSHFVSTPRLVLRMCTLCLIVRIKLGKVLCGWMDKISQDKYYADTPVARLLAFDCFIRDRT